MVDGKFGSKCIFKDILIQSSNTHGIELFGLFNLRYFYHYLKQKIDKADLVFTCDVPFLTFIYDRTN